VSSLGCLSKYKASLSADLLPIPGNLDISSTTSDNSFEENSIV
jgi:hypothetical protein